MDRSYRMKMEQKLNDNTLTIEYVINCVAKYENKINQLAYKEKQYRYVDCGSDNYKIRLEEQIAYRKPFVNFLMKDCHMSLEDIKNAAENVKEKNIPTKVVCDKVRDIILSGVYLIE